MKPVYSGGKVHVLAAQCKSCIFRPGNLMHLPPGRVAGMVRDTLSDEAGNIPCHETLDGQRAICRGWWDRYADRQAVLRLAQMMEIVTEVEPPAFK